MEVQILEYNYESSNVADIESQLNNYFKHNDVHDVQVTKSGDQILVFCFYED